MRGEMSLRVCAPNTSGDYTPGTVFRYHVSVNYIGIFILFLQILRGRDVMGHAETGGGKTAAFVLPILHYVRNHI